MVRPLVQQTTAVEKIATHGSQEEGEHHFMRDSPGKPLGGSGGRGSEGRTGQESLLWVRRKEWGRQGKQV